MIPDKIFQQAARPEKVLYACTPQGCLPWSGVIDDLLSTFERYGIDVYEDVIAKRIAKCWCSRRPRAPRSCSRRRWRSERSCAKAPTRSEQAKKELTEANL